MKEFCIMLGFCYFLYAAMIHPNELRKKLIEKALETYQAEIRAGIVESKIPDILVERDKPDE